MQVRAGSLALLQVSEYDLLGELLNLTSLYYAVNSFFLDGAILPNNSIVLLSSIGEGSSSLLCLPNAMEYCTELPNNFWRFPNDSEVREENYGSNIYMVRSSTTGILSRRNGTVGPAGIYICIIDANLSIGVYNTQSEGANRFMLYLL